MIYDFLLLHSLHSNQNVVFLMIFVRTCVVFKDKFQGSQKVFILKRIEINFVFPDSHILLGDKNLNFIYVLKVFSMCETLWIDAD